MQLAYFPPLNYTCYPAVSKQYIVPRDNPWIPSDGAFSLMKEMAEQVGDRKIEKWIHFYERYPYPVVARCLAVLLHRNAHAKVVDLITERLKKATSVYPNRSFGEKEDENIGKLLGRAEKRKEELERAGIHAEVLHEDRKGYAGFSCVCHAIEKRRNKQKSFDRGNFRIITEKKEEFCNERINGAD